MTSNWLCWAAREWGNQVRMRPGEGQVSRGGTGVPWTDSAVHALYMTLILITICFWLCSSRRTVPDAEVHRGVRLVDR